MDDAITYNDTEYEGCIIYCRDAGKRKERTREARRNDAAGTNETPRDEAALLTAALLGLTDD